MSTQNPSIQDEERHWINVVSNADLSGFVDFPIASIRKRLAEIEAALAQLEWTSRIIRNRRMPTPIVSENGDDVSGGNS